MDKSQESKLPEMFRPLLWSYRFEDIDPMQHKEEIIVQTINYGNLDHWRWIKRYYGEKEIRAVLERRIVTEFTKESRNLAKIIFSVDHFRDARGSAH